MENKTMRVMWCERPNEVALRQLPVYDVGPDEVLIKVAYAGICPWDVRAYFGLNPSVAFPRVLGHECAGYIVAVGENVTLFEVGQPVVPDFIVKCGVCRACRTGRSNRCRHPTYMQFGGAFADYVRIPQQNIYPLRPGTSLKAAAFMEPLACVVRGVEMLRLYPGEIALVAGVGPIGLLHLQVARTFGARVIALDIIPERLHLAQNLGAEWVIHATEQDAPAMIQKITDGWGVDAAVVAVGSARLIEQTLPLLAPGGRLNIFAGVYPHDEIRLDPNLIHYGELILTGSADSTPENMYRALALIESGQVDTESLISHLLPLEELQHGFELVRDRAGLKIMMAVNGDDE